MDLDALFRQVLEGRIETGVLEVMQQDVEYMKRLTREMVRRGRQMDPFPPYPFEIRQIPQGPVELAWDALELAILYYNRNPERLDRQRDVVAAFDALFEAMLTTARAEGYT